MLGRQEAYPTGLRHQFFHQPPEGLHDSTRLNPEGDVNPAEKFAAEGACSRHTHSKKAMSGETFAALLKQTRRVLASESLGIIETGGAFVGLGEDQRDGPVSPGLLVFTLQLAEIADELHGLKVFLGFAAPEPFSIDHDEHPRALGQELPHDGIGMRMLHLFHQRFTSQVGQNEFHGALLAAKNLAMYPVPTIGLAGGLGRKFAP